jgi:hypothetical protein
MFGETFTFILIIGSLIWTAGATLALLVMLIKDWKNGNIW